MSGRVCPLSAAAAAACTASEERRLLRCGGESEGGKRGKRGRGTGDGGAVVGLTGAANSDNMRACVTLHPPRCARMDT